MTRTMDRVVASARRSSVRRSARLASALGIVWALSLTGCWSTTDPPPLGTLDPSSTTHPGVSSTSSTSGAGGGTGNPDDPCVRVEPPGPTITDFSDWAGTAWGSQGRLTGSSFTYVGDNTTDFGFEVDTEAENVHITGVVNDYAGFGMSIDVCTDAEAAGYSGVQFDIWGSVSSGLFQVQTSEDHDVQYDDRATCTENCQVPGTSMSGITEEPQTLRLPWEDFSGGMPVDTLSPDQIIGFQWQFECATNGMCEVDVRIDNLEFY